MANIVIPFAAVAHQQVPSVGFNNNFTEVATKFNAYAVQTDVAKVITVTHQWNAAQSHAGDILFTDALYDIGKAGATRPRDLFLSRNLAVGGNVISDLLFPDGTLDIGKAGATRPRNIFASSSVTAGAFVQAGVAFNIALDGRLQFTGNQSNAIAAGTIFKSAVHGLALAGATGSSNDMLLADAAGNSYIRVPTGTRDIVIPAGSLTLSTAAGKIIGGVTSISHRNSADTADNLLITDAGVVTARVSFNTAAVTIGNGSPFVAGLNLIPLASDPSAPNNGDLWITTGGAMKARLAGATKTFLYQNPGTGYGAFTNTINRATVYDTTTVTLAQLAARVAAIQADLTTQVILSA